MAEKNCRSIDQVALGPPPKFIGKKNLRSLRFKFTGIVLLLLASLLNLQLATAQSASGANVDFAKIREYALLSKAAYEPEDNFATLDYLSGYRITDHRNIPQVEVSYLTAINEKTGATVIAVRGTANAENAMVDIAIKLRPDAKAGIKLHEGFALAATGIYQDLQPQLDKSKTVHLTGHSLGGAVAQILAMYLQQDDFDVGNVITFGQPKVTNIAGNKKYADLNLIRVVTPRDLVPLVPPLDPLDLQNVDIYWHGGTEILLNNDHTYSILSGASAMLRATKFTQRMVDQQNVDNHKIDIYLGLIENKLSSAEQLPYKNDFNLFNLFGQ
jgi:pimeloyl-ACP methyl ester carboxylesterase